MTVEKPETILTRAHMVPRGNIGRLEPVNLPCFRVGLSWAATRLTPARSRAYTRVTHTLAKNVPGPGILSSVVVSFRRSSICGQVPNLDSE